MLHRKRLSILLTLCMIFCLMPVTARAEGGTIKVREGETLEELPAGEYAENYGTIVTNNGTVTGNYGTVTTNNGTVTDNYGQVVYSYGTISKNKNQDGVIGSVYVNYGTVEMNRGTIGLNRNLVEENHGAIDTNLGIVNNETGGTVATNSGEVYNFGGTVGSCTSTGTEYFEVIILGLSQSVSVSADGLTSAYDRQWLGHVAGVPATTIITVKPSQEREIKEITGLPDNVIAQKNTDGSWTLYVTSGKVTTITIPTTTEKIPTLTVNNGTGTGNYQGATTVTIKADEPEAGKVFKEWTGTEGLHFYSGSAFTPEATFRMPWNDLTVTATYEDIPVYTVTYQVVNGTWADGTTADKTEEVVDGERPAQIPTGMIASENYESGAWSPDPDGAVITGAETFTYTFEAIPSVLYTIKFVNEDGTVLQKSNLAYGDIPSYTGKTPEKEATAQYTYTFAGWDPAIEEVTGDATYKATYTATTVPVKKGTLTFNLGGGTLDGKTGTITIEANVGDTIKLPGAPMREGYTFQYWKGSRYEAGADYKVEGDHAFTAEWKENEEKADPKKTDPAKTYTVKSGNGIYKLSGSAASLLKPKNKNITKLSIPATVSANGKKYKVTAISAKSCKGLKKLKSVTIGKNVVSIGKSAFQGCGKLKTITFKTKKLTAKKVGANAFKGINSKAKIKVPKKKLSAYKKLLKKKGIGKKVKITK